MDEERAARLLGCPERRVAVREIEIRSGTGNTFIVRGYASVVDHPYEVYGGPERGGWIETIKRGAFDTTLAAKPDVSFLLNHEGMPLARTRSGTLQLRADNTGLESEAVVDRRDPFGQALEVKMERGDLDQMSFGFRTTRQTWNEDYTERDITEVNLDHGDVSVVNEPANPATSINIVSARAAVGVLREMKMAEVRSEMGDMSPAELREAQDRLGELIDLLDPRPSAARVEVEVVPVLRKKTAEAASELRALLLSISGTEGEETDAEDDSDEDEDDDQVSSLIGLLSDLITNSNLVLTPARSAETGTEVRSEVEGEAVVVVPRPSARLLRARMADEEYRASRSA